MAKSGRNLAIGIVIGAAAGFVAGVMMTAGKTKKTQELRGKISDLAADAQERIKALKNMVPKHEATHRAEAGPEATNS